MSSPTSRRLDLGSFGGCGGFSFTSTGREGGLVMTRATSSREPQKERVELYGPGIVRQR